MALFSYRAIARRWMSKMAAVLGLFGLLTLSAAPALVPVVDAAPGSRIGWQGGSWYLHGANLPWLTWACDFGCNANGGVSSAASISTLSGKFASAQSAGMHAIRWWVFEGNPWQVTTDAAGAPNGINPAVYADFDAALKLAQQYDLYVDFVLFSAPSALPAGWLNDATQQQALANALGPLFAHYRGNPRVLSWEVFNEPDFDVWNGKVSQASMAGTVKTIAASVHANSTAMVTVGMGFADGLPMVVGTGLDYYQAHWYDYMSSGTYCMRCNDYAFYQARFGLDEPLVIGEFYAGTNVDGYQRYQDFYNKGYAGAWTWSLSPEKTSDHMAIDFAAATRFASQHADLGPRATTTTRRRRR